jgi:putative Mg2+ transporter-C (MgtC) family protein
MDLFDQLNWQRELWVLLDVFIAMILGGLVGLERERQHKPAGLRTHMLIAGAANVLVFLSISLSERSVDMIDDSVIGMDPIRIIQAIIVGVSFIGAGTIFKSEKGGESLKYLTTAASILFTTAIGIGVALDHYILSVGLTLIVLFTNYLLKRLFHQSKLDNGSKEEE